MSSTPAINPTKMMSPNVKRHPAQSPINVPIGTPNTLDAGIGFGALLGGLIVSHIDLHATIYFAAGIGFIGFIIIVMLKKKRVA
ncbi:hypothetical protein [Staphylococcus pseudintermedius]|uniref:hypothetical protein n=1 Tax=Staphylococcus pseudintermedius TaxID=283734 RepID=UPI001F4842A3|nr:hypothetical protein [Staphylococcus pseudintermedius]